MSEVQDCPVRITMAEVLESAYVVQVHELRDLAFVYDTWGNRILAAVQMRRGSLPRIPYSPAAGWEAAGDHRLWTTMQVDRALAWWLNQCRDLGAELSCASHALEAWWMDGVQQLTAQDVGVLVGVPD
jgi:hypothetical protein